MSVPPILLEQVFTRKIFALAGTSLIFYDYLITFSLEVAYIWHAPWTTVKALFLINRYGSLIGQGFIMLEETGYLTNNSHKFCVGFELCCTFVAVVSGESIRLLVVMRACAILGCKRSIRVLTSSLYIVCALGTLVGSVYWIGYVEYLQFEYLSEIGICFETISSTNWLVWIVPLFFDGLVLALVAGSLYRTGNWTRDYNPSVLIRLLARDALLFYFTALFNALFFIACWTLYRLDPRNALAMLFSYSLLSVVGQRLVLNLRRTRTHPDTTRNLTRDVHRQVVAMGDIGMDHPLNPDVELEELGEAQRVRRIGGLVFTLDSRNIPEDPEVLPGSIKLRD